MPPRIDAVLYDRLGEVPPFNPDEDVEPLHPEVAALRDAVHEAAAILFSTPEYAGALPGSVKNLLDWMIGDSDPRSIYEKPVAWITTSPRGAEGAQRELRTVLGYAHATIVEAACRSIPITSAMLDEDGLVGDGATVERIAEAVDALASALSGARRHAPGD